MDRLRAQDIQPAATAACAVNAEYADAASTRAAEIVGILTVTTVSANVDVHLNRNLERNQHEWRLPHIADAHRWRRRDEILRSQPLVRDHALGLALPVGKGREAHRRHAREERIRTEKEAAVRRTRSDRMRSLAKVALPNQ